MDRYTYAGLDNVRGYFVQVKDVLAMLEEIRQSPNELDALIKAYADNLEGVEEEAGEPV